MNLSNRLTHRRLRSNSLSTCVQPFGGEGLSGTGPKAGGPHYLVRFCAEQTITVNTTAAGGNAALLAG
jgi:RHH-type proline utilization regulon transcriptional repressor/proline dehydrogenase/delta 1-pyrroline-5-carboxylate dehydrogenase